MISSDLVKVARKGDKKAFIKLVQMHEKVMYRVAKSILQNEADCCDAVQETILKAYEGIIKLNNPEFFKTWLLKILINNCNQIHRKNKRTLIVSELPINNIDYNNKDYSEVETKEIIEQLDEDLKILVLLYYFDDLPIKNISKILDIPEGTIKSRLSRAREQLSIHLNHEKGRLCYE